jgi:AGZA family xanthine/uracil permease-like MFS transporter
VSTLLARYFELDARGTTVAIEARGALATFLTTAYILFANPAILSAAGVPFESAVACTAAAAGLCCLLMGLLANFPMALASGMGLNAIVAYQAAPASGSWQAAMGLVVLDGVVILVLVLAGLREAALDAIPRDLRRAIGAGIGLFVAFIGAVNAKLVVVPPGTLAALAHDPGAILPPVTYGSLAEPAAATAMLGLGFTAFLMARRVRGAFVLGIAAGTLLGIPFGITHTPAALSWPSFAIAFEADLAGALHWRLLPLLLAFVLVDFFDTLGSVTAIAEQAGLADERGRIPRIRQVLLVDSLGAITGGLFGVSSVTSYIESAAGVAEGARTGLHTVLVGVLFLLAVFLAPLASIVPAAATAPVLLLVGFLMCAQITLIDFGRLDTAIPAFVTLVTLPLTYSISHGIGYGFITYAMIKLLGGQARELHPLMAVLAGAFAAYFVWAPA